MKLNFAFGSIARLGAILTLTACGGGASNDPASVSESNQGAELRRALALSSPAVTDVLAPLSQPDCLDSAKNDFIDALPKASRLVMPRDCRVVLDNPVNFFWPEPATRDKTKDWVLVVRDSTGIEVIRQASAWPRLFLDRPLRTGKRYSWTVSYFDSKTRATVTSEPRRFEVPPSCKTGTPHPCVQDTAVPNAAELSIAVKARSTPRVLPVGMTFAQVNAYIGNPLNKSDYATALATFINPGKVPNIIAKGLNTTAMLAEGSADFSTVGDELGYIEALGFRWRFNPSETSALEAARKRLLNLASFSTAVDSRTGEYSVYDDRISRRIYFALALGYDLIGDQLTAPERDTVIQAFNARLAAAMTRVDILDKSGYDGFANTAVHYATQSVLLVMGRPGSPGGPDFSSSEKYFKQLWPLYVVQSQNRWEEDGGYDGSVAYAWWDFYNAAPSLAIVNLVTGVDLSQRSYFKRLGDYLIAMTTPNKAELLAFGDGAENKTMYANYTKDRYRMYAAVTRQPQHEWYWRKSPANSVNTNPWDYISPLHYMLEARGLGKIGAGAPPVDNDKLFADVGMVAMHNDISSSDRSSLFFRASRFGNYNHAHADQNAFTFNSRGENLLINSGYYAGYSDQHHMHVTRRTRYKNAVTFDGGLGQAEDSTKLTVPGSMDASGALSQVLFSGPVSIAVGDATPAYRRWDPAKKAWAPLLNAAQRSVAYFKADGVVVVYDYLSSSVPRNWEWNFHTELNGFSVLEGEDPQTGAYKYLKVRKNAATACIRQYGPSSQLSLSETFDVAPAGASLQQHHAVFASPPSTKAVSVTVLIEDCASRQVEVKFSGDAAHIAVGSHAIFLDKASAQILQ